jgi:hypothetical protein
MGNIAVDRATWARAVEYKRPQGTKYEEKGGEPPTRDLAMDTLRGVLDGEILVQNHCYRADEMAIVIDMAKEFGYHVTAFHHAVEAYKIADLLKANNTCAAVWADWYGFKMEAYDGIPENLAILEKEGACAMIHSDDENGIQRLNQEVAKARAVGRRRRASRSPRRPRGSGWRSTPPRRWASPTRPAASSPARWPTWCCGTAIRSASTRGPRWCGSTGLCSTMPTIPSAGRYPISSSASRARGT